MIMNFSIKNKKKQKSRNLLKLDKISYRLIILQMPERKVWTQDQDKILRFLRQQRKEKKWATIARIMQQEFNIKDRSGKQCRQRYHNHLDSNIINTQWSIEQEEMLYFLHQQMGNKWSAIAQKIPGRSDNCVKNHFYSRLRRAVRKLNKIIQDVYTQEYKQIKNCMLSKIIEITQSKFKTNSKEDEQFVKICNNIKNKLFKLQISDIQTMDSQEMFACKQLIEDIQVFDRVYRKHHKSNKKNNVQCEYKIYLKPPKPAIKRQNSNTSNSECSDDGSSFVSSASFVSSCSDISEYDGTEQLNLSTCNSTRKSIKRSPINGQSNMEQENIQEIKNEWQNPSQFQKFHENLVEQQSENDFLHNNKSDQFVYNNMFFDDTPVMARIFAPSLSSMNDRLFKSKGSDSQEINYAEQKV